MTTSSSPKLGIIMGIKSPPPTTAIGAAGAKNAALLAVRILALKDNQVKSALQVWMAHLQEQAVNNSLA